MKEHERIATHHSLTPKHHEGHPQTVAVFDALANGFNVPVTPEHHRYWKSMLTVGRAIDSYIDTFQPASVENEHQQLIAGEPMPGVTPEEAHEFKAVLATLSPERQAAVHAGFFELNDYAHDMRTTRGITQFLRLRTEEAELFGRVMQLDNPDQIPAITEFNTWLPRFARAGYLIDSFGDLSQDHRDHIIGLHPTLPRRFKLGRAALHEARQAVADLPPRTVGFLAVASLSKIIRNGFKKKSAPSVS